MRSPLPSWRRTRRRSPAPTASGRSWRRASPASSRTRSAASRSGRRRRRSPCRRAPPRPMRSRRWAISATRAALLTNLPPRDVLFIDEIHRLTPAVEEILYPAMEDFQLDLIIGEGPAARSVRIDLPPFTLIGATTRSGLITRPLRERFGIPLRLTFYDAADLERIVSRGARVLGMDLGAAGAGEIARRSRGTPRVAARLLRRVRDFAAAAEVTRIDPNAADSGLNRLRVHNRRLDAIDRRYLLCIAQNYGGRPVGPDTAAAALPPHPAPFQQATQPPL